MGLSFGPFCVALRIAKRSTTSFFFFFGGGGGSEQNTNPDEHRFGVLGVELVFFFASKEVSGWAAQLGARFVAWVFQYPPVGPPDFEVRSPFAGFRHHRFE